MKDTAGSSGSLAGPVKDSHMSSHGLYICTTCFSLTSFGEGMQRCRCEEYKAYPGVDCPSGYHLCYMCAALVTGGTGRYSWNVCDFCLTFNRKLARDHGISLPVGRHSIMNGIALSLAAKGAEQKEGVERLLRFVEEAGSIEDWGLLQARTLFESVAVWKFRTEILRSEWEERFHLSKVKATSRSVAAFKGYLGVVSLE